VNDTERADYADAQIVGRTYRFPNKDGSPDKRYTENPQDVPIYRFGRLSLALGASPVELLTTNPVAAQEFQASLTRPVAVEAVTPTEATEVQDAETSEGEEEAEERQDLQGVGGRGRPSRPWRWRGRCRARWWKGVFTLVALILLGGWAHYLIHADPHGPGEGGTGCTTRANEVKLQLCTASTPSSCCARTAAGHATCAG